MSNVIGFLVINELLIEKRFNKGIRAAVIAVLIFVLPVRGQVPGSLRLPIAGDCSFLLTTEEKEPKKIATQPPT